MQHHMCRLNDLAAIHTPVILELPHRHSKMYTQNLTPFFSSTVHNTYIGRVEPTGYSNTQRADRQTVRQTEREQTDRQIDR